MPLEDTTHVEVERSNIIPSSEIKEMVDPSKNVMTKVKNYFNDESKMKEQKNSKEVMSADDFMTIEQQYTAHNYHPLPVVLSKGEGCYVWDVEGKRYYDFLSGYSAVSQGHCHPRLVKKMIEQSSRLTLTSRAFYNDMLGEFAKYATKLFGYDKLLPMNTGVEAGETAVKLARKWGYQTKGISSNCAKVVMCVNNFWGRSIAACSSSSDIDCYKNYGPYTPGFILIEYNNIQALKTLFEAQHQDICAFYVEPIQGEAGVIVPHDNYLQQAYQLCTQYNILLIADEIQTGLGRCGTLIASYHDNVQPHILVLGKALSGGMMPVSAVLANDDIMLNIQPGTHGSTYGGNPLGCAIAIEALKVIEEEGLCENASKMGEKFRNFMKNLDIFWIKNIRGRGLLNAIEVDTQCVHTQQLCIHFAKYGILCKPTHECVIRFSPPLIINNEQMTHALSLIQQAIQTFQINKQE